MAPRKIAHGIDQEGGFFQFADVNPKMILTLPPPSRENGPDEVGLVGYFGWGRDDRVSGRYGGITLSSAPQIEPTEDLSTMSHFLGRRVRIRALVLETGDTSHPGDLIRGHEPSKTMPGTSVELGVGYVMALTDLYGVPTIVFCRQERMGHSEEWIDPKQLYRLIDHKVGLLVERAW